MEIDVDKAGAQLDTLIERRAREAQDANGAADAWAQSVRSYNLTRAAERREAWAEYHRQQAASHRATLAGLIAHHEDEADRLASEAAGGGGS